MQKIVEIKNLQKNFGKFQALKNVTLDVNAGEVLGYIGPNGSGKSTTIRVLLGIIKKSGGSATITRSEEKGAQLLQREPSENRFDCCSSNGC